LVTLLAGLYPAFILSRFNPVLVLKNNIVSLGKSISVWVRQILTVSQFVIAQTFLIVVFVVGKQIRFVLNKDMGFKKDAIISFYLPDGFSSREKSKKFVLANEIRQIAEVQNVSIHTGTPVKDGYNTTSVDWRVKGIEKILDNVHTRNADSNYINLFQLHLLAGRNLQINTKAPVSGIIINETLLHQLGFHYPAEVIGQYVRSDSNSPQIVGVVKDFSTMSLHNPISPTIIYADNQSYGYVLSMALNTQNPASWKNTIGKIEKAYKSVYPNNEFDYKFFDESIKALYETEARISLLLKWATSLAIIISCLGLLGLVSFMANSRTKEIGIRKVLGASVTQIIFLLSKSLIKLIIIASVIAFPIAWYFSHKWLEDFAFRTNISWWIFLISAVGMLAIALTVLCLRTLKSAMANPVESLRTE
jgi:ABC-type antimicrobial peptide transport system permease subunit